jgi:antitoxin component YwqK of YwqJK toxin-antitoxin module
MKNVIYFTLSLVFLTGFTGEKVVTDLQGRGGMKYEKNTEEPFKGKYMKYYGDGQKDWEGNYKDGKKVQCSGGLCKYKKGNVSLTVTPVLY